MTNRVMLRAEPVSMAVGTTYEDIWDEFVYNWAQGDRYWWWPREIFANPQDIIAEDEEGNLWRIPYSVDDNGNVTINEDAMTAVQIEYTPVAASAGLTRERINAAAVASIVVHRGRENVALSFSSRAEAMKGTRPNQVMEGGASVTIEELRSTLGLPEGTSESEVLRIANERLAGGQATTPDGGTGQPAAETAPAQPATTGDDAAAALDAATQGTPAQPQQPGQPTPDVQASVTVIERGALAQLQEQARLGAEARAQQIRDENNRILSAAVSKGKISPASRASFEKLLSADRAGTIKLLEELDENTIPVEARGSGEGDDVALATGAQGGYPDHWLPDVAARKAALAARGGALPRVMHDSAVTEARDMGRF